MYVTFLGEGPLPRSQKPSRQFPLDIFRYDHFSLGKKSLVPNPLRDRIRYGTKSVMYKIRYDQIRYGTKSVMGQNPVWDEIRYQTKSDGWLYARAACSKDPCTVRLASIFFSLCPGRALMYVALTQCAKSCLPVDVFCLRTTFVP